MGRPRSLIPQYRQDRDKGRAIWTDANGHRQTRTLPGKYNSAESKQAFVRLVMELEADPAAVVRITSNRSVAEICGAYLDHAERHFRDKFGRLTTEFGHVRRVALMVNELYGAALVEEFGPLALKAVRLSFVKAKWCRKTVNQQLERVKRMWKWAASEELVPVAAYQSLLTVSGLRIGKSAAPESKPVLPVDPATVAATLPHVNRFVRGLIRFQQLTGCRPGEACILRQADIDMAGEVWTYRPPQHKGTWRGKQRAIAVGPQAQSVAREFFTGNPEDYLFSPSRAVAELRAERSAARKTPCYPSHMQRNADKRKAKPKRVPDECYNARSLSVAIARACKMAGIPHWHPNQLRHTHATAVRARFGLEAAQVALGHARADVTQLYAEKNQALAATVAAAMG